MKRKLDAKSGSIESTLRKRANEPSHVLDVLSDKCQKLRDFCAQMPTGCDVVTVKSDVEAFKYSCEANQSILVPKGDITHLFRGACLNISVLQVWIQCLSRICKDNNLCDTFAFMCPQFISASMVQSDESFSYMSNVMLASQKKRFIIAPYHQDNHWMLLVICPTKDVVIVFDSVQQYRKLVIRPQLNMAFAYYKNAGGKNKGSNELKWVAAKCAQQEGGTKCGYFVMRYMLDIVKHHHASLALTKDFKREVTYSNEELDEVRTLWADHVLANNSETLFG